MREHIAAAFYQGTIPAPSGLKERPLSEAVAAYRSVNEGSDEKVVLIPS